MNQIFQKYNTPYHQFSLLSSNDIHYFETLQSLTDSPQIPQPIFESLVKSQKYDQKNYLNYFQLVIKEKQSQKIVAAGTLIVEQHLSGNLGQIENIVVHQSGQRKGFGLQIMKCLSDIADYMGCKKMILYCLKKNEPFYEKLDYKTEGMEYFKRN